MQKIREAEDMLKEVEYEMVLVKMFFSFIIAVGLMAMVVFLLGINVSTCNLTVLLANIGFIGMLLWAASVLLDEKK